MEVAADTVITAYKVSVGLTVEEKPLTLEAYDASIWVHRDGTGARFTRRAWPGTRSGGTRPRHRRSPWSFRYLAH